MEIVHVAPAASVAGPTGHVLPVTGKSVPVFTDEIVKGLCPLVRVMLFAPEVWPMEVAPHVNELGAAVTLLPPLFEEPPAPSK